MMRMVTQLRSQVGYDLLAFRRNPAATFFTVVLPLIFLLLFTSIFGNEVLEGREGLRAATFCVPGILALAIVSATTVNLAMTTVTRREDGALKRVRGTPLPPWIFVFALATASLVITAVMTATMIAIGRVLFDVTLPLAGVPGLLITVLVAAVAFSAMGLALSVIIPSVEAAPAITNAVVLPVYFVSDVFIVTDSTPRLLRVAGDVFPVRYLTQALVRSFDPTTAGSPLPWDHWGVIVGWGVLGVVVVARRFRWSPWGS